MKETFYIVKKGDNLYTIAKNHNMSVVDIMNMNNMTNTLIYPGQKLIIKEQNNMEPIYVIKKDDTIADLLVKFNLDVKELEAFPYILNLKLVEGQPIIIAKSYNNNNITDEQLLNRILIENNLTSDELILLNSNWIRDQFKIK